MNLIILKTDIPHVGPCKESFLSRKGLYPFGLCFPGFWGNSLCGEIGIFISNDVVLATHFCIIIIRFFKKPGSLEI